ncbi:glycolate oxidase iron-sulfur subunit [Bacillus oleivorans]|uniref:Glycolate oxidase iron-sulfur subunit n=1 Tax=Bacillus oleivorans TaxID=1448271 RepID=A0A285D2R2_9BACI|nr:(Fe-S)-binding protein [Bacillus oleivorans]SNX74104.1 glycolate oxidase iron-sulfur subunit [Bacillus oleivorans]
MAATALGQRIHQGFKEKIDEESLLDCMRCGFCLPACPTYIQTGHDETHSPRGRIALIKAVRDGMIQWDDDVENSLNVCLGCRACEPACPAGVQYGHILENAREVINEAKPKGVLEKTVRNVAFGHLFNDKTKMSKATGLLRFYQTSGLQTVTRKIGFLKLFPDTMRQMEKVLPKVPNQKEIMKRASFFPAICDKKATVAFFTGCLMDTMFTGTNNSTISLLQKAGCEVWIPEQQACCGALHAHSGEKNNAARLAKQNIEAFESLKADYIVNNAGGCGAFLYDYPFVLEKDPDWKERALVFQAKIIDISSLLTKLEFNQLKLKAYNQITVTYQDSCHLRNVTKVIQQPRDLIQSIGNVEYIELDGADSCCGSAGIYNLIENKMSMKILDDKMKKVKRTNAAVIVTSNPGCLLQMKLGIERAGLSEKITAVHLVDFLADYVEIE